MMENPFPKSMSFNKKYGRLLEIVKPSDTLGVLSMRILTARPAPWR